MLHLSGTICRHQVESSKLQKEVIYTLKQPGCKKIVTLFKIASVKKAGKSKGAAKKWLWWYRLMAKISITTIQVNFVLIPGEARMRQHKLTWIVDIKIWPSTYVYHHSHFLAAPHWFHNFFHAGHLNRAAPFFTARLFLSISLYTCQPILLLINAYAQKPKIEV